MLKKFTILIMLVFGFAQISFAMGTTGKVAGKVTDALTSEPIIGANIIIMGTNFGAASDVNGNFVILNVPPGTYTVKSSYIGYSDYLIENIRVSVDLTTEVNFQLTEKTFETTEIVVKAEKPMVNKNITNSTRVTNAEDIENLPVRGVDAIVSNAAGVVSQNGSLYVRGSRADGVAYYVDGVMVTDPMFGGNNTSVINNAIEEIQFQAGGYTAEYGGANAGIVSTSLRTGSEQYDVSMEVITDNFVSPTSDRKFLGGYSYGYSEYVLTAGGPIVPNTKTFKFFIAASNDFRRSPARFWDGINLKGIYDPTRGVNADTLDLVYPAGYILNNAHNGYRLQGNVSADFNPILLKVGGTYYQYLERDGATLTQLFAADRAPLGEGYTATGNVKMTHLLASNAYYDVYLNYYNSLDLTMDPDFKHNIAAYGDSIANAALGYTLQGDGSDMPGYALYGTSFSRPGSQLAGYAKLRMSSIGGKFNFLYQLGNTHEFKTGLEVKQFTIRRYAFGSAFLLSNYARNNPGGPIDQWYRRLDNYGYDIYGNETNETGLYQPRKPIEIGSYIQDKMEFSDLVLNVGMRLDYFDTDSKNFKDPSNIEFDKNGIVKQDNLVDVDPIMHVSPRIGFSFPVTDKTVFHAQYGKFVQMTRYRDIYLGWIQVSDNIKGGYAIQNPVGFGLQPEKTISYEIGFRQQLGDNFAFDITGFYKDIKDQIQMRRITAMQGAGHGSYYGWLNGDFSTTKGFEIKLDLRRTERLAATIDYTYSDARGTGSNPTTGFRAIWQSPTATPFLPENIAPLDFNQTHRGAINLDYRFGNDDGPAILSNTGLNLLFSFNSGHNFTLVEGYGNGRIPLESLNSSTTPWNFQIDAKIDKSVNLFGFRTNIYVWVLNVLNTKNVEDVFIQTGSTDDGYLKTNDGKTRVDGYRLTGEEYAQNYINVYNAVNNNNADIYGAPRQIRLGVKIEY